jgi:putative ABC transport system substrate-binding protein
MGGELGPKRLELLRELVPKISNVALLLNPSGRRPKAQAKTLQAAAQRLGLPLKLFNARTDKDLDEAFATMASLPVGGLIVSADAFFNSRSERIATLALRHSIPAIYQYPEFTAAGGLASYGGNLKVAYFELGNYTARILKGEKAGDLPVRRAAHIEMIINRKTAKTLGISIPLTLQGRADELVE